tara:strand:+ start:105 stop:1433 length:1329 start_codon:yes stop_codon:yes gene_type:complete
MKTILKTLLLFIVFQVSAQKQGNIWYFGDGAGLDFNSGNPVTLYDGQTSFIACPSCHAEGTAVISDSSGSLLFYTDGNQIWNKNHQMMPNGDSLLSNISSTQSSLIIPEPGSNRYFFVFNTDDFYINNLQYGFGYSKVDICLDGGLGDVISGQKNISLLSNVTEKLTGIRHANGTDYWILVHKFNSNAFHSFLLTSNGIMDTVISNIGSVHTGNAGAAIGQLKASPNGQKIAIVNSQATPNIAEYFDFNTSSGIVSNPVSIQGNPIWSYYGVSFSPDNSKLYIACTMNGNGIYQFDLNAGGGNPASVISSKTQIAGTYNYLGLQLAPNGKIYSARSPVGFNDYLAVINDPNIAGTSCNYVDSAVFLDGHSASYGFPNFIDSYDYLNTIVDCQLTMSEQNFDSKSSELVKIVDFMGRETEYKPNILLIYIYSDGTTKKVYQVE